MSTRLAIASALSVLMMATFVLFGADGTASRHSADSPRPVVEASISALPDPLDLFRPHR